MRAKAITVGTLPAAIGAIVMYFFDPRNGRGRRAKAGAKLGATFRRARRSTERKSRYMAGKRQGMRHALTQANDGFDDGMNDATLQHKIESEVLRDHPKSHISLNVENGIAVLRGQLDHPDEIGRLVDDVARIRGVVAVRSLLHLPNAPAPTWGPGVTPSWSSRPG